MNKYLNLQSFALIGILANFCYVLFIFLGVAYYLMVDYSASGTLYSVGEIGIMPFEIFGFALHLLQTVGFALTLRGKRPIKVLLSVYFVAELLLMLLDFNVIHIVGYDNTNPVLVILHVLFSVLLLVSFTTLNNGNSRFTFAISAGCLIAVVLPILLWIVFSFQVYFSMIADAIALLVVYSVMYFELGKEELWIDTNSFTEDEE